MNSIMQHSKYIHFYRQEINLLSKLKPSFPNDPTPEQEVLQEHTKQVCLVRKTIFVLLLFGLNV